MTGRFINIFNARRRLYDVVSEKKERAGEREEKSPENGAETAKLINEEYRKSRKKED